MLIFCIFFLGEFCKLLDVFYIYHFFILDYGKAVVKTGLAIGVRKEMFADFQTIFKQLFLLLIHCSFKIIIKAFHTGDIFNDYLKFQLYF